MTDPANTHPLIRFVDGPLFVGVAMLVALLVPQGVMIAAVLCALVILVVHGRGLGAVPRALGPMGVILLLLALWITASIGWSHDSGTTVSMALVVAAAILIGMPTVLVMAKAPPFDSSPVVSVILICTIMGLLVFDVASGGLLSDRVLRGTDSMDALYAMLAVLSWPLAAVIQRQYGWKEATLWLIVALPVAGFGGGLTHWVVIGFAALLFSLGFFSAFLSRVLLWLAVIICGFGPAVAVMVDADGLTDWSTGLGASYSGIAERVEFWRFGLESWANAPILGWGAGVVSPDGRGLDGAIQGNLNAFLHLLVGTGAVGLILAMTGYGLIVSRSIQGEADGWRRPAIAATLASGLAVAVSGIGLWHGWMLGTFVVAAIVLAGSRPKAAQGAALGSIFDAAREDPTLYHFNSPDDDEDDFDYDDDEDADESSPEDDADWTVDPDSVDPKTRR